MAFTFGGSGRNAFGSPGSMVGGNIQVKLGPDLEIITTEALGFLALGGEAKVRLLPSPWPSENLPPPTASLLSFASHSGLLAAAGPDAVIVASTESVRKAFQEPRSGDSEVRPFRPQLTLPMPMRISQVAFTADENYLVLSAEVGGGLAVYEARSLLKGSIQRSFEMSTNSSPLRALVPNPTPEKGELLAIVTTDGKLMMANLKERTFVSGANGQVLKEGVSCVSWSTKGKQLVAGLGDGSCFQMTPEGEGKGIIPKAPNVDINHHVSSITWLENNVFLTVSTPSNFDRDSTSAFNVVTRQTPSDFLFQKIGDPAAPFGLERYPPHHFLLRLKDFPPNLQDLLIVASSASTDVGLFSRSKTPLVADKHLDLVAGVFTMTELYDSRRAQMPLMDDIKETSPIGIGLDLSSREKVVRPIPSDELDESPTPVPALVVLNNEGIIVSWWVIYSESVKLGTSYPGLAGVSGAQQSTPSTLQQATLFGGSSPIATSNPMTSGTGFPGTKQASSTFGSPPVFGTAPSSAFGTPSGINQTQSVWGRPATSNPMNTGVTFGTPSFSSTTAPNAQGVAFGTAALPGNRSSPWGSMATKTLDAKFGQPASLGAPGAASFGNTSSVGLFGSSSAGNAIPPSGGFASFASKGGFAAAAAAQSSGSNLFGSSLTTGALSAPASGNSKESGSIFSSSAIAASETPSGLFSPGGFTLGSTFKPDESAKNDAPISSNAGGSFFGNNFGSALIDAEKAPIPTMEEAEMDADQPVQEPVQGLAAKTHLNSKERGATGNAFSPSTTPISTPAAPKFQNTTSVLPVKQAFFGTYIIPESPATGTTETKENSFNFEDLGKASDAQQASHALDTPSSLQNSTIIESPKIKNEPDLDEASEKTLEAIPEAPLPPEPTSKASYYVGESSVSSIEPDAPLPPDFVTGADSKKPQPSTQPPAEIKDEKKFESDPPADLVPPTYVPGGPEEEDDSDFGSEDDDNQSAAASEEGSGEDVAKDISPTSELHQTPGFTPQSSFGGSTIRINGDSFFTKIPPQHKDTIPRSLFGEINTNSTPTFYPPNLLPSPRSPSPIRNTLPGRLVRPDASRSVSAPGVASQILGAQKSTLDRISATSSGTFLSSLEQKKAEETRKAEAKTRREAEETQALIDKEDESIQKFLQKEIIGTRILDDFIAHQDYVGDADKDSIAAQVEAVYRDINSMIDTLGINSSSLKAFIKGHMEQYAKSQRTRRDLEDDQDWCLVEIDTLSTIVTKDLLTKLENGRIRDIASKVEACTDIERDLTKLRAKYEDIKALLTYYSDRERTAMVRSIPLTAEQAAQQHDLRRDFAKFQKLLNQAEEELTLLRAKLAHEGAGTSGVTLGPTVDAMLRTITKMTNMAEKRSGDIDVLETQMRKLRLGSLTSNGSRENSPFTTPASKASVRVPGTSSTYSAFYTPGSVRDTSQGYHASLTSSTQSYIKGTPPRKKVSGFSGEEKQRLKANASRKKTVTDKLKKSLEKCGIRVQHVDSD